MASTFTATTTAQAQPWIVLIYIDGFGPDGSQYVLCTDVPTYASTTYYLPYLTAVPYLQSEMLPPHGGIAYPGGVSFAVLNYSNILTSNFRPLAQPVAYITADQTDSTSASINLTVPDATLFTANGYYHIGRECVKVSSRSGTTLGVARNKRGTSGEPHFAGNHIYAYLPSVRHRRVLVKLVPRDASSSSEETLIGTFYVSSVGFSDDCAVWEFNATTDINILKRTLFPRPNGRFTNNGLYYDADNEASPTEYQWTNEYSSGSSIPGYYASDGTGVMQLPAGIHTATVKPRFGICGTPIVTAESVVRVFVADQRHGSSFRWSPGSNFGGTAATSRSSGTWVQTSHWVDILLALMTSPASDIDNLTVANNGSSTWGNWACLLPGGGLGIPISKIDLASWMDVRQRTQCFDFPGFFCGHEAITFEELATSNFLSVMGAYIVTDPVTGLIRLILPRAEDASRSAAFALTTSNIADKPATAAQFSETISNVSVQISDGAGNPILVSVADISTPTKLGLGFGNKQFVQEVQLASPALVAGMAGAQTLALLLAMRHVTLAQAAAYKLRVPATFDVWGLAIGDVGTITHPTVPDLNAGSTGISAMRAMVSQMSIKLTPFAHLDVTLVSFGGGAPVIYAPSAEVSSASISGGNTTLTLAANTWSDAYTQDGLPTTDAAAFTVGDVVQLIDETDGSNATSSNYGTITAINTGANTITVSGTFGGMTTGAMAVCVLTAAPFGSASTAQKAKLAFIADAGDNTISGTQNAAPLGDM